MVKSFEQGNGTTLLWWQLCEGQMRDKTEEGQGHEAGSCGDCPRGFLVPIPAVLILCLHESQAGLLPSLETFVGQRSS